MRRLRKSSIAYARNIVSDTLLARNRINTTRRNVIQARIVPHLNNAPRVTDASAKSPLSRCLLMRSPTAQNPAFESKSRERTVITKTRGTNEFSNATRLQTIDCGRRIPLPRSQLLWIII